MDLFALYRNVLLNSFVLTVLLCRTEPVGTALVFLTELILLTAAAVVVLVSAIVLQGVSDQQLRNFRGVISSETAKDITRSCRTGMWNYSRHPNYFGEASFWLGMALAGRAESVDTTFGWTWGGAITMYLFFRVSSHLTDVRNLERRGEKSGGNYETVVAEVSAFVPLPFRLPFDL